MAAYVQDCIMLLGDSLTQGGWEENGISRQLSYRYARRLDVINRGFSGYNTEWGLPVFQQCFAKQHEQHHVPKVRLLAIWFGTNDAAILPSAQHVPLPRFIANMKELVHMITQPTSPHYSPNTRIALITPPPVNTHQRGALLAQRDPPINLDRDFEVTRQYAIAVKDVGIDEGVAVVDVWTKIWDAAGQEERELERFLWDGIHLNAEGYQLVTDMLMDTIAEKHPELLPDNIPFTFSPWAEIKWDDPAQSLLRRPN